MSRDHHCIPWMVRHAAQSINIMQVGADGKTYYRRLKGKNYSAYTAEFGENVRYMKPASKGINKYESRWARGV